MATLTMIEFTVDDFDDFTREYAECSLWASTDESTPSGGYPLDKNYSIDDLTPEAVKRMREDCERFQREQYVTLAAAYNSGVEITWEGRSVDYGPAQAGYDFWLTRNRHGVGFWDRGLGDVGDALTEAAQKFGECNLMVTDDGKIDVL